MEKKQSWQRRVESLVIHNEEFSLSCREIAEEFNISKSQASMDLNLGYALRVYPEMEDIKNYIDAIKFIKEKDFHRKVDA